jgi:hypothetical protein
MVIGGERRSAMYLDSLTIITLLAVIGVAVFVIRSCRKHGCGKSGK